MEAERRRGERTPFAGWVELALGPSRRLARSRDLSVRGLGLLLDPPHPPVGAPVESEFALPGFALPLAVSARVAWVDPVGGRLGLAFDGLDGGVAELLESAVAGRFERG